jgi:hypothetical protein
MQATAEKVVGGSAEIVGGSKAKEASLLTRIASRYGVDRELVYKTLKDTAFRQRPDRKTGEIRQPTNEEMVALLTIADQYGLNPFTRELYAFLDPKSNAIVAIVSIDGWLRIINEHPAFVKMEFRYSDEKVTIKNGKFAFEWIECAIYRSDREAPMVIREYFEELFRGDKDYETPWDTHPKRFHRHKTVIQCGRYAMGFANIVDPDEGERIIEGEAMRMSDIPPAIADINKAVAKGKAQPAALEHNPGETITGKVEERETESVAANAPQDKKTDAPASTNVGKKQEVAAPTYAEVRNSIDKSKDADSVDVAESMVDSLPEQFRAELHELAKTRRAALAK